MIIYVDDMRRRAYAGGIVAVWSHMLVGPWDDPEELHRFAARIGMRRAWYQAAPWPRGHYDVTESRRHGRSRSARPRSPCARWP